MTEFLQQLIRVPPQQIKGFRTLGAEQDADGFTVLLDLKLDVTEFLGLQQNIHTTGFRGGGGVVEELCGNSSGEGGQQGLRLYRLVRGDRLQCRVCPRGKLIGGRLEQGLIR